MTRLSIEDLMNRSNPNHNFYRPLAERFWDKVEKSEGGCWVWTGATMGGHPGIRLGNKYVPARRVAYYMAFGHFDEEMAVLHNCNTSLCVRPEHLFLSDSCKGPRKQTIPKVDHQKASKGCKLTQVQVDAIRESLQTHKALASQYGVSTRTICSIKSGATWKT